ncbi:HTH La-type RNA-binding domain-containing protein [Aphelenchoides besseyi]|nr:HTH La-type RNA-binding domain-containing protein [Aphelenchoides besseyi]KAI6207775.1 HTH La-type RNA-binding domain-containing protein [Aphelenchoides besseyi]
MRGFGFKDNGYFICTETAPRCFVIQEVSDVNRVLDDLNKNGRNSENDGANVDQSSPYLPFLPWWFTSECRQQLLNVSAPSPARASTPSAVGSSGGYEPSPTPEPGTFSPEQLRHRLRSQLEYYFSRENLMNDRYLRSQMDADQYVPIKIVANFPKVARLSNDYELIVNVLRESAQVQVDETGEKVRPVTRRCTIILREIPEDADENEVKGMFDGLEYQTLSYGLNNSWYVTFATEEETQKAFLHLQNVGKTFNNKPVYARIKTGGAPIVTDSYHFGAEDKITTNVGTAYKTNVGITPGGETMITGQITIHEVAFPPGETATATVTTSSSSTNIGLNGNNGFSLGQILANHGYIPRASFRPSVTSTAAVAASQGSASSGAPLSFTTPIVPATMPLSVVHQPFGSRHISRASTTVNSNVKPEKENERTKEIEQSSVDYSTTTKDRRSPYANSQFASTARNGTVSNATPLNKVATHEPTRTGNWKQQRDYRSNANGQNERRERPNGNMNSTAANRERRSANNRDGRSDWSNNNGGYRNRQPDGGRQSSTRSGYRNDRQTTQSDASQSDHEKSDGSRTEKSLSTTPNFDSDFPSLPTEKRAPPKPQPERWSAVVANRRTQPVERRPYSSVVKTNTNGTNGE